MKKIMLIFSLTIMALFVCTNVNAQKRQSLGSGLTLVSYDGTSWLLEDDNRQMTISITIAQAGIDRRNNQMMYDVVCEGNTKKVAQWAIGEAVKAGIKSAAVSGGSSLLASAAGLAAGIIYDEACKKWKDSMDK